MRSTIPLRDIQPLFLGRKRAVYQHPYEPGSLIKIIRPDTIEQRWGAGARWYKFKRRSGIYVNFHREAGEYICLRANDRFPSPAIQPIRGLVETDFGLGLVVEKLVDRHGHPAPTLKSLLLKDGLTKELSSQLDVLVTELLRSGVILSKLNTRNIVQAWDELQGTRLVIVDGMGSKTVIPLCTISKMANAYNSRRKAKELRNEIEALIARNPALQIDGHSPVLN